MEEVYSPMYNRGGKMRLYLKRVYGVTHEVFQAFRADLVVQLEDNISRTDAFLKYPHKYALDVVSKEEDISQSLKSVVKVTIASLRGPFNNLKTIQNNGEFSHQEIKEYVYQVKEIRLDKNKGGEEVGFRIDNWVRGMVGEVPQKNTITVNWANIPPDGYTRDRPVPDAFLVMDGI